MDNPTLAQRALKMTKMPAATETGAHRRMNCAMTMCLISQLDGAILDQASIQMKQSRPPFRTFDFARRNQFPPKRSVARTVFCR
jgi:hypothetical protein